MNTKSKKFFLIILAVLATVFITIIGTRRLDTRKTFSLNGLKFSYPSNWKEPEYINKSEWKGGEVKSEDGTQRIVVLAEINQGYTAAELSDFLNSIAAVSGKKINIDGSEAVKMNGMAYQGSKNIAVFLNAKDKKSQYSISYEVPESVSDNLIDKLFNQIIFSVKLR